MVLADGPLRRPRLTRPNGQEGSSSRVIKLGRRLSIQGPPRLFPPCGANWRPPTDHHPRAVKRCCPGDAQPGRNQEQCYLVASRDASGSSWRPREHLASRPESLTKRAGSVHTLRRTVEAPTESRRQRKCLRRDGDVVVVGSARRQALLALAIRRPDSSRRHWCVWCES